MRQLYRLKSLSDYALCATDGEVGYVRQVFFDDRDWWIRYLVVHTGNWLMGRDVLVIPQMVASVDDERRRINVDLTREQIENSPPVSAQLTVSRHYEQQLFRHYDWQPYWEADPLTGMGDGLIPQVGDGAIDDPVNPYLRGSDEIIGYELRCADGALGEVRDVVLEAPGWHVRYMDITTGGWLSGRDILIASAWLDDIDWSSSSVSTALAREAIESAPSYDASKVISRDYELALYKHYGQHFENDA